MARPNKATVDYFPHDCSYGKTIPILQQKFGLVGYGVWFKLLEQLGKAENHYIDCRDDDIWLFLVSETMIDEDLLRQILDLCARMGAIDKDLWAKKIIFSENFINRIKDAYRNRKEKFLTKSGLLQHLFEDNGVSDVRNGVYDADNPQRKEKEIKEKEEENKISSSDFLNFPDKAGFVYKIRQDKDFNEKVSECCPLDCDLENYYDSLCMNKPEALIHQALSSYMTVKFQKYGISAAGFQKDFANWLEKEKQDKPEEPQQPVRGEKRFIPQPVIKESPLDLDRAGALGFIRNLPKCQRNGYFSKELIKKWNFTPEELEANETKASNTS